jgi:HEAT repeat protein
VKVKVKVPGAEEIAGYATALAGTDVEAAAKAADALGALDLPAAHDALLDGLAMGLPATVAAPALTALAVHPAPPDVAALIRYVGHHNLNVRAAALTALAMYADPAAHAAVINGLHDAAGLVRGAAAAAAAKGRIRSAIEPLFQLLGRGEEPAARALAALADPDLVAKIADQLGKVPDAALAQCLGYILKRADFGPDPARVEVVRAIAKIQDPAAITALTDYIDVTPKNPPRPSRGEAERLVEARLGGGK